MNVNDSMFQSTLPWWERPVGIHKSSGFHDVSIHAPVVGATHSMEIIVGTIDVSIHAPVVGATQAPVGEHSSTTGFNPRSRGGSDQNKSLI